MAEVGRLVQAGQKAYKQGSLEGALELARQALKAGGESTLQLHLLFAAVFTAQQEFEMAERALQKALALDGESVSAWKGMACLIEKMEGASSPELLQPYEKLCALQPRSSLGGIEAERKLGEIRRVLGIELETSEASRLRKETTKKPPPPRVAPAGAGEHEEGLPVGEMRGKRNVDEDSRCAGRAEEGGGAEGDEDGLVAMRAELAKLREKLKAGEKLSGKEKRQLKKLESAEERWKDYASAEQGGAREGDGALPLLGSQFTAESHTTRSGAAEAASMGDGIHIESFSIRANGSPLFHNARLSIRTGRRYGLGDSPLQIRPRWGGGEGCTKRDARSPELMGGEMRHAIKDKGGVVGR